MTIDQMADLATLVLELALGVYLGDWLGGCWLKR